MTTFEETKLLLHNSHFFYIVSTGMDGNYSYINNNYQDKFSYINENMVGQPYYITMHDDDKGICAEVAAKCFQNPERTFPATIRKHDGSGGFIITQWEYKAIMSDAGEPAGVFCLGYDITDFMNDRYLLEDAKSVIEKKNTVLREIDFHHAHRIRMPLTNIMGLAMILENMEMDQNLRNLFDMMIQSSHQLDKAIKETVNKAYEG